MVLVLAERIMYRLPFFFLLQSKLVCGLVCLCLFFLSVQLKGFIFSFGDYKVFCRSLCPRCINI